METLAVIQINKGEEKLLRTLAFKADAGDKDELDSEVWLKEKDEKIAERLVQKGVFQYRVISWGYQEHGYWLTDIGKQLMIKHFKK